MADIVIQVIEDPSDILGNSRTKTKLFAELKEVVLAKGLIVSIYVTEPTGETGTSSEPPISDGQNRDYQQS